MHHPPSHRTRTLILASVLHGFTHVYQVALLPLYLLIQKDFKLAGIGQATFLVTLLMMAYFLRATRWVHLRIVSAARKLLAVGLLINATGFIGLAFAPNYFMALACVAIAGFGGSFFHPAATAMVVRLYPVGTGRALGIIGMGRERRFFPWADLLWLAR
jgi:MFS family permease